MAKTKKPYLDPNNWYYTKLGIVRPLTHFMVKRIPRSFWAINENNQIIPIRTKNLVFGANNPTESSVL